MYNNTSCLKASPWPLIVPLSASSRKQPVSDGLFFWIWAQYCSLQTSAHWTTKSLVLYRNEVVINTHLSIRQHSKYSVQMIRVNRKGYDGIEISWRKLYTALVCLAEIYRIQSNTQPRLDAFRSHDILEWWKYFSSHIYSSSPQSRQVSAGVSSDI